MPDYFRADYKLAYLYEKEKNYVYTEHLYTQIVLKICEISDFRQKSESYMKNYAQNFIISLNINV